MVTISNPIQKSYLIRLFYLEGPNGLQERRFPIEVLPIAAETLRKLRDGIEDLKNGQVEIHDNEVSLSIDEAKMLKDLLYAVKDGLPSEVGTIQELKSILV